MSDASFERLVAEHRHAVLRHCRAIVRDDHLGADAAQETFVRLWRALSSGAAPQSVAAWLRRVATTASLDALRRGARVRAESRAETPDALVETAARDAPPDEEAAARELDERFEHALRSLSEGQRTVFLLRHAAGLPLAQVAETLGLAPSTVKTQFARACLALQHALRAFEPERKGDPSP